MLVCSDVGGIATLRDDARVRPNSAVCIQLVLAVRLIVVLALAALEARVRLSSDTHPLALLDQRDLGANLDRLADNL